MPGAVAANDALLPAPPTVAVAGPLTTSPAYVSASPFGSLAVTVVVASAQVSMAAPPGNATPLICGGSLRTTPTPAPPVGPLEHCETRVTVAVTPAITSAVERASPQYTDGAPWAPSGVAQI